ncbi:hypothetical protein EDD18DRAFT_1364184 [Armillaria luteobubalina]|uniref:Uncharacterized protein n=1 Tax=Armillaria luteobubalina TaxID=153913 RepID=A0AA39P878_9AGAR|nr:hypothetical protein EDD18DRAFT_1364184 [Armillaria luteobubalina]
MISLSSHLAAGPIGCTTTLPIFNVPFLGYRIVSHLHDYRHRLVIKVACPLNYQHILHPRYLLASKHKGIQVHAVRSYGVTAHISRFSHCISWFMATSLRHPAPWGNASTLYGRSKDTDRLFYLEVTSLSNGGHSDVIFVPQKRGMAHNAAPHSPYFAAR